MVQVLLAERLCCVRILAAIFVAALSLGAIPIPEIVGSFNAGDLRTGDVSIPNGVSVTSMINPDNGVPVVRVTNTSDGHIWVPLFQLPAAKVSDGEIRYRMTFDTEMPANFVQPGVQLDFATGDTVSTATPKNFSELKIAEPPLFTAEGNFWNEREDQIDSAAFGVMLYGPGIVDLERAEVLVQTKPFRGFSTETLLLMSAFAGIGLVFALGFMRIQPARPKPVQWSLPAIFRWAFAAMFVCGFFVLPQWESDWTIPFIFCGAGGFLMLDLPIFHRKRSTVS